VLDDALTHCFLTAGRPDWGPGAYIERMPESRRTVLRQLKSDDIANIRIAPYEVMPARGEISQSTMRVFSMSVKDYDENLLCQRPPRSSS
jgi:hypothetical protein